MLLDQIITPAVVRAVEAVPCKRGMSHSEHEAHLLHAYILHVQRWYGVNAASPKISAYDMWALHQGYRMPSASDIVEFLYQRHSIPRYRITYRRFRKEV